MSPKCESPETTSDLIRAMEEHPECRLVLTLVKERDCDHDGIRCAFGFVLGRITNGNPQFEFIQSDGNQPMAEDDLQGLMDMADHMMGAICVDDLDYMIRIMKAAVASACEMDLADAIALYESNEFEQHLGLAAPEGALH